MTTLQEAAQQALEYLDAPSAKLWPAGTQYRIITALRAALAQQDERKPLTGEQISALLMQAAEQRLSALAFARSVEAAHGIGKAAP